MKAKFDPDLYPKFRNKDGSLTAYSFACGYIEERNDCQLYKDGCWHVKGRGKWECFDTLTEARKFFRAFARK